MNTNLASAVLDHLYQLDVTDIVICPGGRNAPLVAALDKTSRFQCYYWYEERSAAFFALGKAKVKQCPVAVITTSGTAVGNLLPAAMEAYYSGIPLVMVTADRPRRFRGSGAPQTAEQVNIFGRYAIIEQDLEAGETCDLSQWNKTGAAHINVCFEEPLW